MGKDAENLKRARRSSSSTAKAESSRPRNKEDKHLVEKRKAFAKEILRQAWDKGRVCDTSKEVRKLLKDEACEKGLSDGFFDVLSNNDLNDICVSVARESYKSNKILEKRQQSSSPIHEMTPLGQKLPPSPEPSDPGDPEDHDGYNEQRRSSLGTSDRDTESSHGIHIDEISFPVRVSSAVFMMNLLTIFQSTQFEVHLFHPTKAHFFIVVAKYIGHQESSWISDKIVRQHKLIPKGSTAQTIRLNWGQMTTEGPKKNSTCFWIVDGRKLKHDILIGTKWDDPNDPESDSSGEDSDEDCADSDDDRGSNENSRNRSGDDESGESSDGEGQISEEDEASGAEDSDGFVNISTMGNLFLSFCFHS